MGNPKPDAVQRAREIFHMTQSERPLVLKHAIDALYSLNLPGLVYDNSPEAYDCAGEGKFCAQGRMACYVLYAEIVEGLPCTHATYGVANLPKLVGEKVKKVFIEKAAAISKDNENPCRRSALSGIAKGFSSLLL